MNNVIPFRATKAAYTVAEAAEYLGVHSDTIRRLIKRKHLKVSKVLRHIRISGASLETFIDRTS